MSPSSVERTWKLCLRRLTFLRNGDEQGAKAFLSSLHSKLEPGSSEVDVVRDDRRRALQHLDADADVGVAEALAGDVFPDTVAFPVARCSAVRMFWNVLPLIVGEPDVIEETPNWASVSPGMSVNTLFVTR